MTMEQRKVNCDSVSWVLIGLRKDRWEINIYILALEFGFVVSLTRFYAGSEPSILDGEISVLSISRIV